VNFPTVNITVLQHCDLTAQCSSTFAGLDLAASCRHSSVILAV